ncbi:hypothetical protein HDV05_007400, partial [Chytridiales sp. JEL 0842]
MAAVAPLSSHHHHQHQQSYTTQDHTSTAASRFASQSSARQSVQHEQHPQQEDTEDPESQLRWGVKVIQEAFVRKGAQLEREVSQWKQAAANQRQQIYALENENKNLHERIADLERLLSSQNADIQSLQNNNKALQDKYTTLKESAAQLESFRKNIVSMVEFGGLKAGVIDMMGGGGGVSFVEPSPGVEGRRVSRVSVYAGRESEVGITPRASQAVGMKLNNGLLDSQSFLEDTAKEEDLKSFQM